MRALIAATVCILAFAAPAFARQTADRVTVTAVASEASDEAMRVTVRNNHAFALEALRLAYGADESEPDGDEDMDYFHAIDDPDAEPDERPIAPGETRVVDLDVGVRDRLETRVWVALAMFSDRTYTGDSAAAEERLRERQNEADDLEYWVSVLRGFLSAPPRQAKQILGDRLAYRRSGDPQRYPGARLRFREVQSLIRVSDDEFRQALATRIDEYSHTKGLAERRFTHVRLGPRLSPSARQSD